MSRPPTAQGSSRPPRPGGPPSQQGPSDGSRGGGSGQQMGPPMARSAGPQAGPPRAGGPRLTNQPAANRVACNFCRRLFAEDRIQTHMAICRSHATNKRQPFDSAKHRLDHVLNEKDIRRVTKSKRPPKLFNVPWKEAHNNWIGAKDGGGGGGGSRSTYTGGRGGGGGGGGAASTENDGRIPCPGCGRKFNKLAAEKHIPYCASKNR